MTLEAAVGVAAAVDGPAEAALVRCTWARFRVYFGEWPDPRRGGTQPKCLTQFEGEAEVGAGTADPFWVPEARYVLRVRAADGTPVRFAARVVIVSPDGRLAWWVSEGAPDPCDPPPCLSPGEALSPQQTDLSTPGKPLTADG